MNLFFGLVIGNLTGALLGIIFSLIAQGKVKANFIYAGILSSYIGWIFSIFLPIQQERAIGALGFSVISAFYGAFVYWSSRMGPTKRAV